MRRSTRHRFIVVLALLSHLLAALMVHVPMAQASVPAVTAESAAAAPCPEHARMEHGSAAVAVAGANAGAVDHDASDQSSVKQGVTDHGSPCKTGLCKCPCAHATAPFVVSTLATPIAPHTPSLSLYSDLHAPDCATPFFRPPI